MNRLIILSALLITVACEDAALYKAGTDNSAHKIFQRTVESDTFDVALGESILLNNSGVEVGFSEILNESRCPSDVVCCWEGMARIEVWLKVPDQDTLFLEPIIYGYVDRSSPGGHKTVLSDYFGITLQQLDPYPIVDTTGVDLGDTIAYMVIEEFSPPLSQSEMMLVDADVYGRIANQFNDPFNIDSLTIADDSLLVHLTYSGGCNEHDFYTFGSLGWMESQPPIMPVTIVHYGYDDACDAIINRTLRIDLAPITMLAGYGNIVVIAIDGSADRVTYAW